MHQNDNVIKKHDRVLEIYSRLLAGEIISKERIAEEFGVDTRSIQRDIDSIREFYSNHSTKGDGFAEIKYDRIAKGFRLINERTVTLTNAELFSVAKILLESRSLNKEEIEKILTDLTEACLPAKEKRKMTDLIRNELFHYIEPRHAKKLIDTIWELGSAVHLHQIIHLEYKKVNGEVTKAFIKPVGIMCSEYYFYLIAYIGENDEKHPGYPTVYRIDRIEKFKITDTLFHVPYKDRFEEGEFRKRIQFMYGGALNKIKFIYRGTDINAILDRLPSAEYMCNSDGSYLVNVEVYGTIGINMWLNSQGEYIEIIQ